MAPRTLSWAVLCAAISLAALAAVACSSDDGGGIAGGTGAVGNGGSGSGGSGSSGGTGGSGGIGVGGTGAQGPFSDLPSAPEIEASLPSDIGSKFGAAPGQTSGGPCLVEPTLDALVPKNWTPVRFEWTAPADQNVFELKLHVDNQVNDLVVYTTEKSYTIAASVWKGLTNNSAGHAIEVTLRGAKLDAGALTAGPFTGAQGPVHIAPVPAPGSVVYWTSGGPSSGTALKGFTIGDTKVTTVLAPSIVGGDTNCVACHASAPGGQHTFYVRDGNNSQSRSVDVRSVDALGTPPPASVVSPTALTLLGRHKQSAPALSKAHYSATDSVALSIYEPTPGAKNELIWTDLHTSDATSGWGVLARTGDPRQPATPTWWNDGSKVAYTSAPISGEGVISAITDADPTMDIYTVPYANKQGGSATPLPGASDASYWEYYPMISPGDALLAFNRCAPRKEANGAWADSYNEPTGEIFVVPASGGSPHRLTANDPPACTNKKSPGVTNSWPKWAPTAESFGGKKYYWVVFSSTRRDAANPQLFVAGVVTTESGGNVTIEKTHPALYVTAQVPEENNHTPAWDTFQVKPPS